MLTDGTHVAARETAGPETKGTAVVGDVATKPVGADHPVTGTDTTTVNRLTAEHSWQTASLADANKLFQGGLYSNNDGTPVPGTRAAALTTLEVHDIWGAVKPQGNGTVKGADGVIHSDAATAHGAKVHADVKPGEAQVEVAGGPTVDVDRKAHTSDYISPKGGEWSGHIDNGKGEITNKATGTSIAYDGHEYVAKDKDGKVIAESSNPKELTLEMRGLEVHVGHGQTKEEAIAEQQRQQAQGTGEPKAYQDPKTGDWSVVHKDAIIRTNNAEHYVEITDKNGKAVRMRRGDDGQNHFYQMVDGKEQELTLEQQQAFSGSGLDLNQTQGVSLRGKNIVGNDLTVRPTEDAQIASTGELTGKDVRGQDVRITNPSSNGGTPSVQDGDLSWQPGQGLTATGPDGSCVNAGNFQNPGFQITDADNTTTNLGMDNSLSMSDPSGDNLFTDDSNGNAVFADDTTSTDGGNLGCTTTDSGGYGQGSAGYATADTVEDQACGDANTSISYVMSQLGSQITPDCYSALASSEGELKAALGQCVKVGNWEAAADAQAKIGEVELVKTALTKPPDEARKLIADGATSPYLKAECQRLWGSTPQGAVAFAEDRDAA